MCATLRDSGPASPLSCGKARKECWMLRVMMCSHQSWAPAWTTKANQPCHWVSHELLALSLLSGWWKGFTYFSSRRNFFFKYKCWVIQFLYKVSKTSRLKHEAQQPCREQLEKMEPDPASPWGGKHHQT